MSRRLCRFRGSVLLLWLALAPPTRAGELEVTTNDEHILTTIANGIYAIRHKRAAEVGQTSGNTTVVVGDREVLVVDSTGAPSFARADIEQIRKWTDKPIRYLVNTHWHGDHTWGNGVYLDELPGVAVIGHRETPRLMVGYLTYFLAQNRNLPTVVQKLIDTGRDEQGEALSEADLAKFRANQSSYAQRAAEFASVEVRPPNLTFERELDLDLGNRPLRLLFLGRGNTSGDVVIHLPREKVVVAGDLLVFPMPYLLGGFPSEWAKTLGELARLEAEVIVPGHGAVLTGDDASDYLRLVTDLLATVSGLVSEEVFQLGNGPATLDAARAAVLARSEITQLRSRFTAMNEALGASFDASIGGLVTASYREVWGN